MKFREKLLILFVAVVLSFLGFYLISTSFVDLHMLAKEAGNKTAESYLAKCDGETSQERYIIDNSLQFTCLDSSSSNSRYWSAPGVSK